MLNQNYNDVYNYSISNPEGFWNEIASEAVWTKPYKSVLNDKYSHSPKWFVGGEINMSYNCLDRHVLEGHGDDVAVIHDSTITGTTRKLTYNQLLDSVSLLAGVLVDRCGMKAGDTALLYFPVVPECLISMLACARIGVSYCVVFGGFAEKELANRINNLQPKMILTCNIGSEFGPLINYKDKLDSALTISGLSPQYCLVFNRPYFKPATMVEKRDLDWTTELLKARHQKCVPLSADHPLFLIYTSGTTGQPKCLVHLTGNSIVYNIFACKYIFCFTEKDTFWALSNFGWIVGQSLLSYGALMLRFKTVLYEGHIIGIPDNRQFTRVLNWHKVTFVGCPTTVVRLLQKMCSEDDLKLTYKDLHTFYIGGETSDPLTRQWIEEKFRCKVGNSWGQTELGGTMCGNYLSFRKESCDKVDNGFVIKSPGMDIRAVDRETGAEVPNGTTGRLVIKLPLPPSLAGTFFGNDERFFQTYFERFPGYYDTMDAGIAIDGGLFKIVCREDDVINVAAARICSTAVEDACIESENISQAMVIPLEHELYGHVPFAFLIRSASATKTDQEIIDEAVDLVMKTIGEVAKFERAVVVSEFPRIVNQKLQRSCLISMIHGKSYTIPGVIINPNAFPIIYGILIKAGFKATLPQ